MPKATTSTNRRKVNGYVPRYRNAKAITVDDLNAMLAKHPYCADPTRPEYAHYKRVLCKAMAIGTKAVKTRAERRLTSLERAVNGYTCKTLETLKPSRQYRALEGPHTKDHQCKPVFSYRYPDTDSRAMRIDRI